MPVAQHPQLAWYKSIACPATSGKNKPRFTALSTPPAWQQQASSRAGLCMFVMSWGAK